MQEIRHIFLHWTGTGYDWREPGHYHAVIDGAGVVHRLTPYHEALHGHTEARNDNSVALAVACMGTPDPWDLPPTDAQIESLVKESAKIAVGLGWPADPTKLKRLIMTHAEAAALRDFPVERVRVFSGKSPSLDWDDRARAAGLPTSNYGPVHWPDGWPSGDGVRWDLFHLTRDGKPGSGGFLLRDRIASWMKRIAKAKP